MSRLYHIYDADLAELEQLVPHLTERLGPRTDNTDRVKIRRVKEILSNVRWNYQPHYDVQEFSADGPIPENEP